MPADYQTLQTKCWDFAFLFDGTLGYLGIHQELFFYTIRKERNPSGTFPSKIKLYFKAGSPAGDKEG